METDTWVRKAKASAIDNYRKRSSLDLDWQLDTDKVDSFEFKGYEAAYKPSEVSGLSRLYYDRNRPYTRTIPFYNSYKPARNVSRPSGYIIPQAYDEVIERLTWNGVENYRLEADSVFEVTAYYIRDYKDMAAYEGQLSSL